MTVRNSVHRCIRLLRLRQRITVSCPATHLVRHGNAAISVDHCSLAHDAERGARHNEIDPLTVVEPAHAVDAGDEWQLGGGRMVGSRRPAAREIGQGRGGHRNADLAFLRHWLLELAIHGRRAELPNDCGFHRARGPAPERYDRGRRAPGTRRSDASALAAMTAGAEPLRGSLADLMSFAPALRKPMG